MTKEEKSKIKYRMKRLARKFCRRNHVYESFDSGVKELIEKGYLSAYLLCLHENKNRMAELEKENAKQRKQLTKAKEVIRNLLYVYQLGKNELAIARISEEAEQFLKEVEE